MSVDIASIRACLGVDNTTALVQVAYTASQAAAALGVHRNRVQKLIHSRYLPARNTGNRYLISGALILEILRRPHPDINDPAQIIDPTTVYFIRDVATLLGVGYSVAQSLIKEQRIVADRRLGYRPVVYGSTLLTWLADSDKPLQHPESA